MVRTLRRSQREQDDALIAAHVEPHPTRPGLDEWRLKENGVPVWAIIGELLPNGENADEVARGYLISPTAVAAARAYYRRHRGLIDARLEQNRAW